LAFFNGLGAASKYGILIKGGQYLEILGKLDTIGFDKTGTLTEGVFDINELHIVNNKYTKNEVIKIVASMEVNSNHPIALSIVNSYKRAVKEDMINNIQVITGSGIIGKYKDKRVIVGSHALLAKNNINSKSCDCDLTHVYIAIGNEFVGYLGLGDKIKPGAKELIKELKKLQIKNIIMLTGNIKKNAQLISNQLDIKKYFYELLPKDKLDIISEFEAQAQKGKYVCFCGDGVNDAPSLARADVGIAMGNIGSQVSVDAADCVITDDNLLKIISTIRIAKRTLFCSKLNIALSLGFKICILALSLISNILFIPMILDIGL
jgi:Cd2+/Zn2+-exporting ATPase